MKVIRVFPRKTSATPDDSSVRIRTMPTLFDEADEVHISTTFTWDLQWTEKAVKQWRGVGRVKVGGPAFYEEGGEFTPGMYLKEGYVVTSRGCPNRCWFCSVPKREGYKVRELKIRDGWIVMDDNLLACSNEHIENVFNMLKRQKVRPIFTGGLEAKLLSRKMAEKLKELKPQRLYFAYDTPDDLEFLREAGKYLRESGFSEKSHCLRCYVLIGYKGDSELKAFKRMQETFEAGFMPMAMLYRDDSGKYDNHWRKFQRQWANPIITYCNFNKYFRDKKNSRLELYC